MKAFKSYLSESDEDEGYTHIHYSKEPNLNLLTGVRYGSGIRGAESERLNLTKDFRLKHRVYFYPKPKSGFPQPEQGLGGHVYAAKLTNMYDPINRPDPEIDRIAKHYEAQGEHKSNAFEKAILDKGYHGYHGIGMSVVMNKDVPVKYLGTKEGKQIVPNDFSGKPVDRTVFDAPANSSGEHESSLLKPHQMEFFYKNKERLQSAAPSLKIQYGRLNVKTEHLDSLKRELSKTEHPL